jgi:hypothetical protein
LLLVARFLPLALFPSSSSSSSSSAAAAAAAVASSASLLPSAYCLVPSAFR